MSGELVGGFSVADILAKRKAPSLSCLKLLSNILCRRWKWGGCHGVLVTLPEPYKEKDYRLELVGRGGGAHVSTHDPFYSRVMECPGHVGPFQGLQRVLAAGVGVSHPSPVAWYGGYPQGVGGKRAGQLDSAWELPPSPPHRGPAILGDFTERGSLRFCRQRTGKSQWHLYF